MVSEEIVEGLKIAVAKGESLYQAMMSFYNSGYSKEEIENAARFLQQSFISNKSLIEPAPKSSSSDKPNKPKKTVQRVSNYGEKSNSTKKSTIILLILLTLFLIGGLISIFMFKEELITLFNSFFD